ncbi:helix-turn-helix domain-containing protein [Enterococcus termitis]|uniref:Transcriptional regulator n=1 Tax=Enterococcus termitis TaxID=332950 RepID=A0A1E5G9H7_9ENTE|nr:helix-turn-helix transcriptional regulator [Enterococcus termitis]OEG09255.1 transcriptional regulator [Enterococcus termitis]
MNNFETFLSERLHKFRTKKNVSAREMSIAIGQNENYINSIENKRSMPSIQMLYAICEYLEISISDFLYEPKNHSQLVSAINNNLVDLDDETLEHILAILKSLNNK